jgi:hypothetical protein
MPMPTSANAKPAGSCNRCRPNTMLAKPTKRPVTPAITFQLWPLRRISDFSCMGICSAYRAKSSCEEPPTRLPSPDDCLGPTTCDRTPSMDEAAREVLHVAPGLMYSTATQRVVSQSAVRQLTTCQQTYGANAAGPARIRARSCASVAAGATNMSRGTVRFETMCE